MRYWWLTFPIGIATSLMVQLFTSDSGGRYARSRWIALAILIVATAGAAAPAIGRAARDPLRRPAEVIRAELLEATALGSSPSDVLHALRTRIPYDREAAHAWGSSPMFRPQPAFRYDGIYATPVGAGRIETLLGWYYTPRGRMNVFAKWVFDSNDRLIDVLVQKNMIR
jgi:hypothetical protein